MVSVYRSPQPGQEFAHFYDNQMAGDGLNNNNNNLIDWNTGPGLEDPTKKIRKPYTITKSRESWSEQEHDKFLEALQLFNRDWKKIEAFVGSRTVIQIRSHAQKYFLKVQKNGTSEHIPPPRPKRKAAHPYPHKRAPKNNLSQVIGSLDAPVEPGNAVKHESITVPTNPISGAPLSPWTYNVVPSENVSHIPRDDIGSACDNGTNNYYRSSSSESAPNVWTSNETKNHRVKENYVKPYFAQVYRFIGSIFDPSASDHLQRLKTMDPVNLEMAVMLMKNLSDNLVSPEFENHRKLLSSSS